MQGDAVTMGRLLLGLTHRERAQLAHAIKRHSGVYETTLQGLWRRRSDLSNRNIRLREVEELMVPSVLAGRVPVERADVARSMRDLGFSTERILQTIAQYSCDDETEETETSGLSHHIAPLLTACMLIVFAVIILRLTS